MREQILKIVDEVTSKSSLSDGEQCLEIATQVMHLAKIPQHEEEIGRICDQMTELGAMITAGTDPEKLAPEQLADMVE